MQNLNDPIVWPGKPYPLGATWDGEGVNFALFSEHAEKVELCLFDPSGRRETQLRFNCASRPIRSGTAICRRRGPDWCTAIAFMVRTIQRRVCALILTNCCWILTRSRCRDLRWNDAHFGYRIGHRTGGSVFRPARQRSRHDEGGGDRSGVHLGDRPAATHSVA